MGIQQTIYDKTVDFFINWVLKPLLDNKEMEKVVFLELWLWKPMRITQQFRAGAIDALDVKDIEESINKSWFEYDTGQYSLFTILGKRSKVFHY